MEKAQSAEAGASRRLNSWKEIARYFGRDERTVKRWEADRGLPIRRIPGEGRSKIYAEVHELEAWLKGPQTAESPAIKPSPAAPRSARLTGLWALAAIGSLALILVGVALWTGTRASRSPERNPLAAELYRRGMHNWSLRTAASLNQAVDDFTQAVVQDPKFADAYVGLARSYSLLREYSNMPDSEAYPHAEAAAKRALSLDPKSQGAYAVLAFVDFYYHWDVARAEQEIRKAIELKPEDATNHLWYANMLKLQRRFDEALAQAETAGSLDPESTSVIADRADILMTMGREAEGEQLFHQLERLEPQQMWPHAYLGGRALVRGNFQYFLSEKRLVNQSRSDEGGARILAAAERGYARGGGEGLLRSMLAAQTTLVEEGSGSPAAVACTYAQLNEQANALRWLHVAVERRDAAVLGALVDRCFERLRDKPELDFIRKIVMGPRAAV